MGDSILYSATSNLYTIAISGRTGDRFDVQKTSSYWFTLNSSEAPQILTILGLTAVYVAVRACRDKVWSEKPNGIVRQHGEASGDEMSPLGCGDKLVERTRHQAI